MFDAAASRGLVHRTAEDARLDGRCVTLAGRKVVNFGSASYVGLEMDDRLKEGAVDAVRRYGVQFASSRAYLSCPLYTEFESLLEAMLGAPTVVAQTTSLAHFAALPVLVREGDAIVYDEFVHRSVQAVLPTLRESGVACVSTRHNDMNRLETCLRELAPRHRQIWYAADGVYSMTGGLVPMPELRALLDRFEQLRLYIDDAHGVSWTGLNGRGTILDGTPNPRVVVALSLAKAFAASGAALVFPHPELARIVRTCGSTMIFSGPLQPALLGAGIASAKIHLGADILDLQRRVVDRVDLFNRLARERDLELGSDAPTPIRYVKVGSDEKAYEVTETLLREGFFTNLAAYPAVPRGSGGIRISLTVHHTPADLRDLVDRLASAMRSRD